RCVSNIKHRPEKDKPVSSNKGKPVRIISVNHREIQHIDYPAVEEAGIASLRTHKCGNNTMSTFTKQQAIKCTVNNVAYCTGHNHAYTNYKACMNYLFLAYLIKIPSDTYNCQYPKQAKE